MEMLRLKTDKVDARIIAQYGLEQNPLAYKPLTTAQKEIRSLRTVLNNLIKHRTMTKNLLHSQKLLPNSNKESLKVIKSLLKTFDAQINKLENQIEILIKEHFNITYKNTSF